MNFVPDSGRARGPVALVVCSLALAAACGDSSSAGDAGGPGVDGSDAGADAGPAPDAAADGAVPGRCSGLDVFADPALARHVRGLPGLGSREPFTPERLGELTTLAVPMGADTSLIGVECLTSLEWIKIWGGEDDDPRHPVPDLPVEQLTCRSSCRSSLPVELTELPVEPAGRAVELTEQFSLPVELTEQFSPRDPGRPTSGAGRGRRPVLGVDTVITTAFETRPKEQARGERPHVLGAPEACRAYTAAAIALEQNHRAAPKPPG